MNDTTSASCPVELPAIGSTVHRSGECNPEWITFRPTEFQRGWKAWQEDESIFDRIKDNPRPNYILGDEEGFDCGVRAAKSYTEATRSVAYTLEGVEQDGNGDWIAVLSRMEARCLDDVYNGSGTGLGKEKVITRVKVA